MKSNMMKAMVCMLVFGAVLPVVTAMARVDRAAVQQVSARKGEPVNPIEARKGEPVNPIEARKGEPVNPIE
jgi:hypothetical protein